MIDTPLVVQTEAQPTAVIYLEIPRVEIRNVMGPAVSELDSVLAAQGIVPAGPRFSHHLRMDPETFRLEVGVPVATPVAPSGRVKPGQLPAATVARTVLHGGYEELGTAWGELDRWIADQGLTPQSNLWECYVTGPESGPDPSTWRTELNRPLVR